MAELADLLANYKELSETSGESLESIADRVEVSGSPRLAAAIRATASGAPIAASDAPVGRMSSTPSETA